MSGHVVLIGDSIFDNAAYTRGEPDVIAHLRSILPNGWRTTSRAFDGSATVDIEDQVGRVPADATHIMVSVGGNDALRNMDLLDLPVRSTAEALILFGKRMGEFEKAYRRAIQAVLKLGLATTVCTIYNGNFEPEFDGKARIALMMFNDVILRAAFEKALNVIDLRTICRERSDYANRIEPSGQGGQKIAKAIACSIGALGWARKQSVIFAGCEGKSRKIVEIPSYQALDRHNEARKEESKKIILVEAVG